ncbi:hypothetical protein BBJ28_00002543 [Nothophytophthora sp. Chile5]|nr:hypothetical protein BBJ28_00002543 [Nothophytophthora sp. Chile5]
MCSKVSHRDCISLLGFGRVLHDPSLTLHCIPGIGVIKRIRCDEARKVKGGYFLYYGKAAAIQRLAELKSESSQLMMNFHRSHTSKKPSIVEEDSALVKVFEDKAAVENWPCLATTTACFLGLLFLEDYQATVALPVISRRFIEAKRFTGALVPSWAENAHADVHRRVYDVVSVLVSCNLVLTSGTSDTSLESCFEPMDKMSQRKHVRFNYDIFTNPGLLLATNESATRWAGSISHEATLGTSRVCTFSSPTIWRVPEDFQGVHHSLHASITTNVSPEFASTGVHFADHQKNSGIGVTSVQFTASAIGTNNSCPEAPTRSYSETQSACRIQDLFSPLGEETSGMNEWCDESVKQLAFQDALPSADRIDWELTQQFKENYRDVWGALSPSTIAPADINAGEGSPDLVDLECREVLTDEATITESFLF